MGSLTPLENPPLGKSLSSAKSQGQKKHVFLIWEEWAHGVGQAEISKAQGDGRKPVARMGYETVFIS